MVSYVKLLGAPALRVGESWLEPPTLKLTALLFYLAYQGVWVGREELLYLFWPDTSEEKARRNLRQLLTKVRGLDYTGELETEATRLRWQVPTDVAAFREAVAAERWPRAVARYGGRLLGSAALYHAPEFESWLEFERRDLEGLWRKAMFAFATELEAANRHAEATELLGRLVKLEPYDEGTFRRYLRVYHLSGESHEALKSYERFREGLKKDLDGDPEEATLQLVEAIRKGESVGTLSDRDVSSLKVAHIAQAKHNLPNQATPFVGRQAERESLKERLRDPSCRLLTLVGPGGIGKTRLAAEVAEEQLGVFPDGVWFVPLAALSAPEFVVPAVADALDFAFFGAGEPKTQLLEYLKQNTLLLVLDNLEQLLDRAGLVTTLLADILRVAPGIKLLTTSRERLNLQAEWVFDLGGLATPEAEVADADAYDAVRLFVQTAKKVRPDFKLGGDSPNIDQPGNDRPGSDQPDSGHLGSDKLKKSKPGGDAETVTRICRLVGGMPLALELAASWLRVLSEAEIAAELELGADILTSSLNDLPERHHNMRVVFGASWQRLAAGEQTALCKLSVFRGGFTREAVRDVAEVSLPLLLALSNKSFLRRETSGRFTQHPLLRQYLYEKALEDPQMSQTLEKHAFYFVQFVQVREAGLRGMTARSTREGIALELANIRAAWFWAADNRREDLLDRASEGLLELYSNNRRYQEGATIFAYAAERLGSRSVVHGRMLRNLGYLHNWQTDYATAAEILKESAAIFRAHHATYDEALALEYLGLSYGYLFWPSHETETVWHKCAELFQEVGAAYHEARALVNISLYCRVPKEREAHLHKSIRLLREVDGYFGLTLSLNNLAGCFAQTHGAYEQACTQLDEAIEIERARGMPFRLAWSLNLQGRMQNYRGNFEAAEACHLTARGIAEELEPGFGEWELDHALWGLGRLALLRGELEGAVRYLNEALELNQRHPDPFGLRTDILHTLAAVALEENRLGDAAELSQEAWSYFSAHRHKTYEHVWTDVFCHHQLGEIAFAKGYKAEAGTYFRQGLTLAREWQLLPAKLHVLVGLAELQKKEKRRADLLGLVIRHPAAMFESKEAARRKLEHPS